MGQEQQVTLPWNQASIDKLANAIGSGARNVTYDGRTVTFQSTDVMTRLMDRMVRHVNNQGDGRMPQNTRGSVFVAR